MGILGGRRCKLRRVVGATLKYCHAGVRIVGTASKVSVQNYS